MGVSKKTKNKQKLYNKPMNKLSDKIELPKFKRLVVAVSGGMDSVVLAHLLRDQNIVLAHLNHGIREEADADEQFVKDLAKKWGLECVTEKRKMPERGNLENNARQIRYGFLEEVRKKVGADYIAVAHHFDDQIETVLMHMSRGAGLRGRRGMANMTGNIIRPLLDVSKKEIEAYLQENKLDFVEDKTNLDLNYQRNYWRHNVLPHFKGTDFEEKVRKMIAEAQNKLEELIPLAEQWRMDEIRENCFKREPFSDLDKDLKAEIIIQLLGAKDLYQKSINRLTDFIENGETGKKLELKGLKFEIQYDQVTIDKSTEAIDLPRQQITINGIQWGHWTLKLKSKEPLFVRQWNSGDKFRPSGMQGSKKLQDFFVDAKVPRQERNEIPIIVNEKNAIMAIGNMRVAEGQEMLKKDLELILN